MPWQAPTESPLVSAGARRWWLLACVLAVLPLAAALHWAVFHPSTCMLNNFGHEYTAPVVALWLRQDPSLPWAIAIMGAVYSLGLRRSLPRAVVAPMFIATLAFSLWIWDVPFSGRVVCDTVHDNRIVLWEGTTLRTTHVLGVSAVVYLGLIAVTGPRLLRGGRRT